MQFLKMKESVAFMSLRIPAMIFSGLLIIGSIVSLSVNQLNWGLDFTGGTIIEIDYGEAADLDAIRTQLFEAGFDDAIVQNFGSSKDVLIRLAPREGKKASELSGTIMNVLGTTPEQMRRVEFVGPNVGEELTEQGGLAMLVALLCILVYVAMRIFGMAFCSGLSSGVGA